jgi:hypothetical protein
MQISIETLRSQLSELSRQNEQRRREVLDLLFPRRSGGDVQPLRRTPGSEANSERILLLVSDSVLMSLSIKANMIRIRCFSSSVIFSIRSAL